MALPVLDVLTRGQDAGAMVTLAAAPDSAALPAALSGALQAVRHLDVEGSAGRAARVMMREAMAEESLGLKRGLSRGLEALVAPGDSGGLFVAPARDVDLEARVDAERQGLESRP